MYLMVATRPDLAFGMGKLSQYCYDPCIRHRVALNHLLRYIGETIDYALVYNFDLPRDGNPISFADAANGDDLDDRRSTKQAHIDWQRRCHLVK